MSSDKFTHDKLDAIYMNNNWIKGLNSISQNQSVILYPTGEANNYNGRIYIALPADKLLTSEDKKKYNII